MKSKILSVIDISEERIKPEIEEILRLRTNGAYGCFIFGEWSSFPLWNRSGDAKDALLNQYEGTGKRTSIADNLPYISELLTTNFKTEKLKWVRVFLLEDGHVVPHVDFLESGSFSRIHIPIHTDMSCLHAQEETVFHMNVGEVWYLDATDVHSACSMSGISRIQICLDFEPMDSLEEIFAEEHALEHVFIAPTVIYRTAVDDGFFESIYGLSAIVSKNNFRDIIQILSKLHFEWDVSVDGVFDWMIEICSRSGQKELLDKAIAYKKYCIQERSLGEDFFFFNNESNSELIES